MLAAPGSKDGAVKVVREGGAGVAYQWSASGCVWKKGGQCLVFPRALLYVELLWTIRCVFLAAWWTVTGRHGRRSAQ